MNAEQEKLSIDQLLFIKANLEKERDEAQTKLTAALAANAEMRQLLVESPELWTKGQSREWLTRRKHALSLESGKGFRSPAQVRELIEPVLDALTKIAGAWNDTDAPFESRIAQAEKARLEAALKDL